jgi:predicted SprT family Zn-dependent metalloprotease
MNNISNNIQNLEENEEDQEILNFILDNYELIKDDLNSNIDILKPKESGDILKNEENINTIISIDKSNNTNNNIRHNSLFEESDVYEYFALYNTLFFGDKLGAVSLEWSKRMTLCAGIFSVRNFQAIIRLSEPILKFRNTDEIKETLLHEMIHAWIHVERLDMSDDRSGHGINFQKKMHEINKNTGLNITIYHSFHDEVEYYKKYVWKCNGPCQIEPPYFGLVKRSMNRAPSKSDYWWEDHKKKCGGQFLKIEQPSSINKDCKKEENNKKKIKKQISNKNKTLDSFINKKK